MGGNTPKEPPAKKPDQSQDVQVVFRGREIIIGGRVLQPDQDPLDLMERYFAEGEPDA